MSYVVADVEQDRRCYLNGVLNHEVFHDSGEISIVKAYQVTARRCYSASIEIQRQRNEGSHDSPRPPNSSKVMMVDLDTRKVKRGRPELDGELEEVQISKEPGQTTRINKDLSTLLK